MKKLTLTFLRLFKAFRKAETKIGNLQQQIDTLERLHIQDEQHWREEAQRYQDDIRAIREAHGETLVQLTAAEGKIETASALLGFRKRIVIQYNRQDEYGLDEKANADALGHRLARCILENRG